eukprot:g17542.t1
MGHAISQEFFYWRLRRCLLETRLAQDLLVADPRMTRTDARGTVRGWLKEDAGGSVLSDARAVELLQQISMQEKVRAVHARALKRQFHEAGRRDAPMYEETETTKFTYLLEVTAAQLRCLGLVELAYGYYYDGLVKVAGYITGLGRDADYLEFRVTGTQTERLVEALSDPLKRVMQLHICPKDCNHAATGPDVLHAAGFWEVGDKKLPWHTLFEAVHAPPEERDELAKLREHYAARKQVMAGEKESPSSEEEKRKKKKKKKKKAKDAEKKAEMAKTAKEGTEDEAGFDKGQKPLKSLFGGTCLDPRVEERSKLLKKARRLGKRDSQKRKHASSDDSSSGSSTTEEEELTETGEGLFAEKKRALRLTQRYPGCLGAQTIAGMKEHECGNTESIFSCARDLLYHLADDRKEAQTPRTPRTTPSLQEDRRFQEVVAYIKDNTLKNPESMLWSL